MAGSRNSFSWNPGTLTNNLGQLQPKLERLIVAAVEFEATRGETWMRKSAPWTDRTGNARAGLHTVTGHSPTEHTITFAHSVDYGIWLEVLHAGRFAIIMKSVQRSGTNVMQLLDKGLARLG